MNRLACMVTTLHPCPLSACERASCSTSVAIAHCSHFADFSVSVPLWALCTYDTRQDPHPPPLHPIPTTRTCFIARTMLAITFLSSITMDSSGVSSPLWTEASPGEESHTFRWFTLIKLMKWNACVRVCVLTRLQFWFRFRLGFGLLYPLSYPAEIYISGGQSRTPTRQEVVYKELHLKAAPQRMFPFMSSVESDSESESDSELSCFHAIFMACKGQRNGSQLKASHASSLHSPLHFKGVSLFREMKCA